MAEYELLTDPISVEIMKKCKGNMPPGEIKLNKTGTIFPKNYLRYVESIRDFEVREDDIWVITFPKCGTTWTQEMVWLLKNNLNYDAAKEFIFVRFPFLERSMLYGQSAINMEETMSIIKQLPSPRFIKTHLPFELLPEQIWVKNPKIIYVSRNPKEVALSYFNHYVLMNNYTGTQDEFIEAFLANRVISSPYWSHVLGYWKIKHKPNILFNTFEEMKEAAEAGCITCGAEIGDAHHTLFECRKWRPHRETLEKLIGTWNPANLIPTMLASDGNWKWIEDFIIEVMKFKEAQLRYNS